MPKTTFMNRYPDGSPRPRLGFWRPDPGDVKYISHGYDPVLGESESFIEGDLDVPIYAVEREPGFVEQHCLVSGREHCPVPAGFYNRWEDPMDLSCLIRHQDCPRQALEPLDQAYQRRIEELRKWRLAVRKQEIHQAGPYLTGEPDGRPVRSEAQQKADSLYAWNMANNREFRKEQGVGEPEVKMIGTEELTWYPLERKPWWKRWFT